MRRRDRAPPPTPGHRRDRTPPPGWPATTTALAGVLPRYYDVVAARGEGSWLIDVDGRRFLDLGAGIAVNTTGHCHPRVVEAITDQARTLIHTSVVVHHTRNIALAERIGALCPFLDEPQVFFCNSGAEAVDGALKLARRLTGRPGGHRVPPGVPRPHPGRHHADHRQGPLPRGLRAAAAGRLPRPLLRAPRARHTRGRGGGRPGRAGPAVRAAAGAAGQRGRHDRRARARRGRLRAAAPGLAGGPAGPLRRARHPAGLRRGAVRGRAAPGGPFAAEAYGVRPDVLLFAKGIASGTAARRHRRPPRR